MPLVQAAAGTARVTTEVLRPAIQALISACGGALRGGVDTGAVRGADAVQPTAVALVAAPAALKENRASHQERLLAAPAHAASPSGVAALKLAALTALGDAPYVVEQSAISSPLEQLRSAATIAETRHAARELSRSIEASHTSLVERAVAVACAKASIAAGFPTIESAPGLGGITRVVATNEKGRALVSEIRTNRDGEINLETEVVGVSDGSCVEILNRFDQALEAAGVRPCGPPTRRSTGGVAELEGARQFLRRKLRKVASPVAHGATQSRPGRQGRARLHQPLNPRVVSKQSS